MELTYMNALGERLVLKQQKPYFLTRLDGVGQVRQTVNTYQSPSQDGAFFISSTVDMRNITIEGKLIANTTDEAYAKRGSFLKLFTPKSNGTLIHRNLQIPCTVEEAGFQVSSRERYPDFFVSLLCPSPYFETLTPFQIDLATWLPLLEFELAIDDTDGIEFDTRQPSQIMTVDNPGDVSCGCMFTFSATGSVTNPEILNMGTGEFLRLHTTLTAGETIQITTHFASKHVTRILAGVSSNAFPLLDSASTFMQLATGRNMLRYGAAENVDLLEVRLKYRPLFLGV